MRIIGAAKESLRKLLWRGGFDESNDSAKHGTARLVEMLNQFSNELRNCKESDPTKDFLIEEIKVLEDAKVIELPNFLPREAFQRILHRKVEGIYCMPVKFAEKIWDYIEEVVLDVLMRHSELYYQLKVSTKNAAHTLVQKMREQSTNRVKEIVMMERLTGYTCNLEYTTEWTKLMSQQENFLKNFGPNQMWFPSTVRLEGFGDIAIEHLRKQPNVLLLQQAFDLKMRMTAY